MKEDEVKALLSTNAREKKTGNLKKRWHVCVRDEGKEVHLGYFETEEEAREACREYRLKMIKKKAELPLSEAKEYNGCIVFPNGQVFNNTCKENNVAFDKGYMRVRVGKKNMFLHKLLAELFVPNPNEYEHIIHINGDVLDNAIDNLKWCSREDYLKHRRTHMVRVEGRVLDELKVKEIKKQLQEGVSCNKLAKIYNVNVSSIRDIKEGVTWADVEIGGDV